LNDEIEVVPDWVWDVGRICSTFWSGGGIRPVVLQSLAEFRVVMYGCGMNVLAELTTDCVRVGMEVLKDLKEYDSLVDEKNGRGPEWACVEGECECLRFSHVVVRFGCAICLCQDMIPEQHWLGRSCEDVLRGGGVKVHEDACCDRGMALVVETRIGREEERGCESLEHCLDDVWVGCC
jgi:hypothetical protein